VVNLVVVWRSNLAVQWTRSWRPYGRCILAGQAQSAVVRSPSTRRTWSNPPLWRSLAATLTVWSVSSASHWSWRQNLVTRCVCRRARSKYTGVLIVYKRSTSLKKSIWLDNLEHVSIHFLRSVLPTVMMTVIFYKKFGAKKNAQVKSSRFRVDRSFVTS